MKSLQEIFITVATFIGLLAMTVLFLTLPTLLLWNWLMPTIFDLPYITFWQALGLTLLARVLLQPWNYKKEK